MLGVDTKYMAFSTIDSNKTSKPIDDKVELEFKDGKIYLKNDDNFKNEINLYVSYKY